LSVTIKQIAEQAGVSRGTVDRVLHGRPGVRPEVAEQVRQIADVLGFLPNRAGKILAARKHPLTIGCFFPGVGNAFFDDVSAGFLDAQTEFAHFGVSVLIKSVEGFDHKTHMAAIDELLAQNPGALCVSTVDIPPMREYINKIVESGIPVVAVNTDLTDTKRLFYIGCDYLKSGRTAAGLLSLMAFERLKLLIVTGSLQVKGHNERITGFCRMLRQNKVPYQLVDVFESLDNDDYAYTTTLKTLRENPRINCIYITAAGVAGVCRAVQELGLQKKLRVISYDDTHATRKLVDEGVIDCIICQEPRVQGYRAIQMLFDYYVEGKEFPPRDYITDTVIKIRQNIE